MSGLPTLFCPSNQNSHHLASPLSCFGSAAFEAELLVPDDSSSIGSIGLVPHDPNVDLDARSGAVHEAEPPFSAVRLPSYARWVVSAVTGNKLARLRGRVSAVTGKGWRGYGEELARLWGRVGAVTGNNVIQKTVICRQKFPDKMFSCTVCISVFLVCIHKEEKKGGKQ